MITKIYSTRNQHKYISKPVTALKLNCSLLWELLQNHGKLWQAGKAKQLSFTPGVEISGVSSSKMMAMPMIKFENGDDP